LLVFRLDAAGIDIGSGKWIVDVSADWDPRDRDSIGHKIVFKKV